METTNINHKWQELKSVRDALYAKVCLRYEQECGPEFGGCFYYAEIGREILKEAGLPVVIEAGTMNWPIIRPEDDDGKCSTHFGYVWSPHEIQSLLGMASGGIPEMHVWLRNIVTHDYIDFSTGGLRKSAERMGFKWRSANPPPYLWQAELPPSVVYQAITSATAYTLGLVHNRKKEREMQATMKTERRLLGDYPAIIKELGEAAIPAINKAVETLVLKSEIVPVVSQPVIIAVPKTQFSTSERVLYFTVGRRTVHINWKPQPA